MAIVIPATQALAVSNAFAVTADAFKVVTVDTRGDFRVSVERQVGAKWVFADGFDAATQGSAILRGIGQYRVRKEVSKVAVAVDVS